MCLTKFRQVCRMRIYWLLSFAVLIAACGDARNGPAPDDPLRVDVLIRGGTDSPSARVDVGITGDRIAFIGPADERGIEVAAAQHPYTATQSNLRSCTIPDGAAAGGAEAMTERFNDAEISARIVADSNAMPEIRGGADRILFADPRPDLNGRTLAEIAADLELAPVLAAQAILRDGDATGILAGRPIRREALSP